MSITSQAFQELVAEFERLPGIGRKTAERLSHFVLRSPAEEILKLAHAIQRVKETIHHCKRCYNLAESDECSICADPTRERSLLCVVEQPRDVYSIEQSGSYRGLYHVLQGTFAPLDGVAPEDLTLKALLRRLVREDIEEVILATNPDFEGEGTALYLRQEIGKLPRSPRVTRLARGMPSGSQLEYVSRTIVSDALEGRREME